MSSTSKEIDILIEDHLDLDLDTLSGTYLAKTRRRCLRALQISLGDAYDEFDWDWKYASATVSFVAGDGAVPTSWATTGPEGGIYISGMKKKLEWAHPKKVIEDREILATTSGDPSHYAVHGNLLILNRLVSGDYKVYYQKIRPTLVDSDIAGNGLDLIPLDLHEILTIGAGHRLLHAASDAMKTQEVSAEFKQKIGEKARLRQHGREQLQQIGEEGYNALEMF